MNGFDHTVLWAIVNNLLLLDPWGEWSLPTRPGIQSQVRGLRTLLGGDHGRVVGNVRTVLDGTAEPLIREHLAGILARRRDN
ncbi:MAG: hypothetical protein ABI302_01930 [Lacisediminihabitans sp.]